MNRWSCVFSVSPEERVARSLLGQIEAAGLTIAAAGLAPGVGLVISGGPVPDLVRAYLTEPEAAAVKRELIRLVLRGPWLSDLVPAAVPHDGAAAVAFFDVQRERFIPAGRWWLDRLDAAAKDRRAARQLRADCVSCKTAAVSGTGDTYEGFSDSLRRAGWWLSKVKGATCPNCQAKGGAA